MKNNEKVLITGGAGFIGKVLGSKLFEKKIDVQTFDRESGDIRKWADLKDVSVDLIYHLAAITYVPLSFENPRLTYETNVLGTLNVLELCRQKDVEKLIYTSAYVYGYPQYLPIDEKHPVSPTNPYMHSKLIGEELCRKYNELYGIQCIIIRPFNIYGEGQNNRFLIPNILKQAKEKGKIVLENPEPRRDLLYVGDLVDAYLRVAEHSSEFEIFNVGYGKSYSVREIVDRVIEIYGGEVDILYSGKKRKNEIPDVVANNSKAKKELGWSPKTELQEWLQKTIKT